MRIKVIIHEAEEGGLWAEIPELPGCATQGGTYAELFENLEEAIKAWISTDTSSGDTEPIILLVENDPTSTSPELLRHLQAAREEIEKGDFISLEEMKRELS